MLFLVSSGCLCFLGHGSLSPFPKPAIDREVFSHDAVSLVPILLPPLPRFKDPHDYIGQLGIPGKLPIINTAD